MSKTRIKKKVSTVSLITITQLIRFDCLQNLYELIKLQNYKNIIEWVIVEGSKNEEDGKKNKMNMVNFINNIKEFKVKYVEYTGKKLSDLRNIGNCTCTGDIIVCMDDDDYYPPTRVSTAVEALEKSGMLIAGCSDIYLYEYFMNKLYKGFPSKSFN
jgi:glycosyltransferase involved in cell wall biosynthesis